MKKSLFILLSFSITLLLLGVGWFFLHSNDPSSSVKDDSKSQVEVATPKQKITPTQIKKLKTAKKKKFPKKKFLSNRTKPNLVSSSPENNEEDEDNLTPAQKTVLKKLQSALDANDLRTVRRVIAEMNRDELKTGKGGEVPVCMRQRAVEALGWFGRDAAIDLISYLGDPNDDVRENGLSQFEMALEDSSMSDMERSAIVQAAMRAISDPDVVDTLLAQLNNMRPSVRADTATAIFKTGTKQAQAGIQDNLEFYFDDNVKNVKDLSSWKIDNPDDDDADEFYGGEKSEDGEESENQSSDRNATIPQPAVKK